MEDDLPLMKSFRLRQEAGVFSVNIVKNFTLFDLIILHRRGKAFHNELLEELFREK